MNYYVSCKHTPHHLYHVLKGSGMGDGHSGPVANCSFYDVFERSNINPAMLTHFSVKHYFRYEDDIFLILRRDPGMEQHNRDRNHEFMTVA